MSATLFRNVRILECKGGPVFAGSVLVARAAGSSLRPTAYSTFSSAVTKNTVPVMSAKRLSSGRIRAR